MGMDTTVAIERTPQGATVSEVKAVLRRCLTSLGGLESLVQAGSKILIKPNVGVVAPPESARNTDARVIEALVLLLMELDPAEVCVAEASVVGTDTMEAFEASGIFEAARRSGAKVLDLKSQPFRKLKVKDGNILDSIRVAQVAGEVDVLISLPKLKTITAVPVSLSFKNMKGLLPDSEKRRFHHTDLNKAILDLNTVITPQLVIIDGMIASELYEPKEANLLIAGLDPLAVDTVGCLVVGVPPETVPYLKMARDSCLGTGDIDKIEIAGPSIEEVRTPLRTAPDTAEAFAHMFPEVKIIDGNSCSGCAATVYLSLKNAKEKGLLPKMKGMTIAIGKDARPQIEDERTVYLGNCLKDFQDRTFLPGCPFLHMDFIDLVEKQARDGRH